MENPIVNDSWMIFKGLLIFFSKPPRTRGPRLVFPSRSRGIARRSSASFDCTAKIWTLADPMISWWSTRCCPHFDSVQLVNINPISLCHYGLWQRYRTSSWAYQLITEEHPTYAPMKSYEFLFLVSHCCWQIHQSIPWKLANFQCLTQLDGH